MAIATLVMLLLVAADAPAAAGNPSFAEILRQATQDHKGAELLKLPLALESGFERLSHSPDAAGFISPEYARRMLASALKGDFAKLERFPTVTLAEIGAAARTVGGIKDPTAAHTACEPGPKSDRERVREPLGIPTGRPALAPPPPPRELGLGITQGYLMDPDKQTRYADSERLACVLNRLALNDPASPSYEIEYKNKLVRRPEELLRELVAVDHETVVRDVRSYANFGRLRYQAKDVVTPLWLDTETTLGEGKEHTLKVPACHAEHQMIVRGPQVKADVCFYLGTDGEARFRPLYVLPPAWVGRRVAHEYRDKQALECVRLAGEVRRAFAQKKAEHPDLPLGGYFTLGVCTDSTALIELGVTGKTTLYPLTRDLSYFSGEGEVDRLARRLPVDGHGKLLDWSRLLGSLPETDFTRLTLPRLREDLELARKVLAPEK